MIVKMHLVPDRKDSPEAGTTNPFDAARDKLFPDRRNRKLEDAADAISENRVDIAQSILQRYLEKHPDDPPALNLMADIARRADQFEEAERLLLICIENDPDCPGYRFNYAVIIITLEKYEEALAVLDVLLKSDARNPLFRDWKAKVLSHMERFSEALTYRRELAEEYPEIATVWVAYGNLLRHLGKQEEAIVAYQKANAYTRLADLKTYRFSEAETTCMQAQLVLPDLSKDEHVNLCFALGTAYGDQKRYAESFDSYAKGNALLRAGLDFDSDGLTAHRMNCERLFTEDFFRQRSSWGCESQAPVFIVGMPRSGSTLIEQILSSHSAIEGLGELAELDNTVGSHLASLEGGEPHEYWISSSFEFRSGFVRAFSRAMCEWNAEDFYVIGQEYLAATRNRRRSTRQLFTDKEPRNFGYIALIHLILPAARIIDARRHPLDCGWSCFRSRFPANFRSRFPANFAQRLADIGKCYANYARLMAHFDRVLPGRIHRVIYEDLIANPEMEVRRLLDYLGLPFEEGCLRFHETVRAVNTLSSTQVRVPLYQTGMAQWRPYEPWLGPLKTALGDVLERYPNAPDDAS